MPILRYACLTDCGKTHPGNEDRWFADPTFGLYLVSDGMAHAEPAQLVVDHLPNLLRRGLPPRADLAAAATRSAIQSAIREVNILVWNAAHAPPHGADWQGLGATVVLAVVRPPHALLAHLGDSRIYLLRAGYLRAMTHDHSLLEELVSEGKIAREDVKWYPFNGGPTRFAGMAGEAQADTCLLELQVQDRMLLCSDGLTCVLEEAAIQAILNKHPEPAEACRALVEAANEAGGNDNITALVVAWLGAG